MPTFEKASHVNASHSHFYEIHGNFYGIQGNFYEIHGTQVDNYASIKRDHTALPFLSAGAFAGAVSRTVTAPFDRIRVFLSTRPPDLGGPPFVRGSSTGGLKITVDAVARIYGEAGVLAFWTGNGLSVTKIIPESATKFFAYESSKRAFAKYWDQVENPNDISGYS